MESSTKKPSEATSIGKVRLATDCVMLTPVEKAVLIQLAMHCFDHPTTTEIGPAQIVINTCFKERAVREALKDSGAARPYHTISSPIPAHVPETDRVDSAENLASGRSAPRLAGGTGRCR
jgi:hypothetical protein